MANIIDKFKLIVLPLLLFLYGIYSYSQTTPNLVLSSNPVFWQFQQQMWQLGYHQRPLSSIIFGCLVGLLFVCYLLILNQVKKGRINLKQLIVVFGLSLAALVPSYPALSNDVFNYLMNAKMMHEYGASPYEHAAWDFPDDPWPKFMMNVHTTTPYGYVWTGLGYIVYGLTWGDLQFGMLGFRLLAVVATVVIGWSIWIPSKKNLVAVAVFWLNPLVLIEAVSNTHNDITMMAFFMLGLALFFLNQHRKVKAYLWLGAFWILSVYTKLITVISPVVYLGYLPLKKIRRLKINVYDLLAIASVSIMWADGSKRFFSWYLLWSLPFSVLAKNRLTKSLIWGLSFGGLVSYLPYLYTGEYTQYLGNVRYILFFAPGFMLMVGDYLHQACRRRNI